LKELKTKIKEDYEADQVVKVSDAERVKFDRMLQWMRDNGASINKCKIRWFGPDYRGVVADRDIKKDDVVMFVPRRLLANYEKAAKSVLCERMFDQQFLSKLEKF
jgi:hypothetical protein